MVTEGLIMDPETDLEMGEEVGCREGPQPKKCPNGEGKINSTKHTIASTLFFSICLGKLRKGRKRKEGV